MLRMAPTFGHLKYTEGYCPVQGKDAGVGFALRLKAEELNRTIRAETMLIDFSWAGLLLPTSGASIPMR
jgi:alpha-L-rhamnosidase